MIRASVRTVATLGILAVASLGNATAAEVPSTAERMYFRNCASCHGLEGRGDGPAAGALSPPPTDLTRLTATVPELMRAIDGRRTVRAHGSAAMPVWGEVFEQSLIDGPRKRRTVLLSVQWLAEYVSKLQRPSSGAP